MTDENERRVDLKWSLWMPDREVWEEYAPGVWDWMASRTSEAPGVVYTSPRKEIRYGKVTFLGNGRAEVSFKAVWDNVADLVANVDGFDEASEAEIERMIDVAAEWFQNDFALDMDGDTIGAEIETDVEAESFEELMVKIDAVENDLLDQEKEHDQRLQAFLNGNGGLLAYVRGESNIDDETGEPTPPAWSSPNLNANHPGDERHTNRLPGAE